jgi:Zn-dependent alcohol dehydrogenase
MSAAEHHIAARAAIVRTVGGAFSIEAVQIEPPRADEVLVRMVGSGICHTDLAARDGFPVPMPIVLGHEGSGIVEAVGSGVTRVKKGDHVILSFASCQTCPNCRKSQPAYCFNILAQNFAGVRPTDGTSPLSQNGAKLHGNFFGQSSFATYSIAHEVNTVVVPKELPLEILGPLGCGVQTGAGAAINSLGLKQGDSFAIFGGGAVGLSALLGALAIGAGPVIVIEPNTSRAALARELGAAHTINPKETRDVLAKVKELSGGGVTHALDTTAIPAVISVAVETMLPNGVLGLLGMPAAPDAALSANLMSLLVRGAGIKYILEGDSSPQEFIPRLVALYRAGKFPFDRLIKQFPFEQINEAVHATESGAAIKPVIVF